MGCVVISGIRYIVYSSYPVCVKSGLLQKIQSEGPFVTLKILQETLYQVYNLSGIRYIRFALNKVLVVSLYPEYVMSGIRCTQFATEIGCFNKSKINCLGFSRHPYRPATLFGTAFPEAAEISVNSIYAFECSPHLYCLTYYYFGLILNF